MFFQRANDLLSRLHTSLIGLVGIDNRVMTRQNKDIAMKTTYFESTTFSLRSCEQVRRCWGMPSAGVFWLRVSAKQSPKSVFDLDMILQKIAPTSA